MASPTTVTRQTPVGIFYTDPFPTTLAISADPDISFWEKEVGTPGMDGGSAINIANMYNTLWRPMHPRTLITLTEFNVVAAYDERSYTQLPLVVNVNTSITIHFPDAATLDFWGYIRVVAGSNNQVDGEQPTLTLTVTPTNWDPNNYVEAGPVMTAVAGT